MGDREGFRGRTDETGESADREANAMALLLRSELAGTISYSLE
jgi:hypothetical protein